MLYEHFAAKNFTFPVSIISSLQKFHQCKPWKQIQGQAISSPMLWISWLEFLSLELDYILTHDSGWAPNPRKTQKIQRKSLHCLIGVIFWKISIGDFLFVFLLFFFLSDFLSEWCTRFYQRQTLQRICAILELIGKSGIFRKFCHARGQNIIHYIRCLDFHQYHFHKIAANGKPSRPPWQCLEFQCMNSNYICSPYTETGETQRHATLKI